MNNRQQQGQTLIETMVAMFVLVMGIGAAFGLATFALSSASGITNQVVGMGLAREGIEVVKNMRDTNWLNSSLYPNNNDNFNPNGCYDFQNSSLVTGVCYKYWLNPSAAPSNGGSGNNFVIYDIDPGASVENNIIIFSGTSFSLHSFASNPNYKVYRYTDTGSNPGYTQLISPSGTDVESGFYRRVKLEKVASGSFGYSPEMNALKVTVDVWWSQKNCIATNNPDGLPQSCKITLETYLTNWKTY